jgi:hypothetical protein
MMSCCWALVAHTTWEAEIGRITVQSQPGRLYLENTHHKKGLVELGSSANPSTRKQKKKCSEFPRLGGNGRGEKTKEKECLFKTFFFFGSIGVSTQGLHLEPLHPCWLQPEILLISAS